MTASSQIGAHAASDGSEITPQPLTSDSIDPITLARLDYGLFLALRRMGTSKERICSALNLSYAEYDYIDELE